MITVKSASELAAMKRAAEIVVRALRAARDMLRPGVDAAAVDAVVQRVIEEEGGRPAFLGYMGYTASSCISFNAEIVHGVPTAVKVIKEGDLVSIDVGVEWGGYFADAAFTVAVGEVNGVGRKLLACGKNCLDAAVAASRAGKRVGDISATIERIAHDAGFNVVREYVGHGIGARLHEEPQVPNYGPPDRGPKLLPGMTVALEPMVVTGDWRTRVGPDKWTVSTRDGGLSAHFEHTIVVGEDGGSALTKGWEEFV